MDPRLRVGDRDREQTVEELQRYVADGYLTLEEFSQRSGAAYQAQTGRELAVLTEDLPRAAPPVRRPGGTGGVPSRDLPTSTIMASVAIAVAVILVLAVVVAIAVAAGGMGGMGGMMD